MAHRFKVGQLVEYKPIGARVSLFAGAEVVVKNAASAMSKGGQRLGAAAPRIKRAAADTVSKPILPRRQKRSGLDERPRRRRGRSQLGKARRSARPAVRSVEPIDQRCPPTRRSGLTSPYDVSGTTDELSSHSSTVRSKPSWSLLMRYFQSVAGNSSGSCRTTFELIGRASQGRFTGRRVRVTPALRGPAALAKPSGL